MALTLRQVQRALHQSKKSRHSLVLKGVPEIAALGNYLFGDVVTYGAALKDGHIWSSCPARSHLPPNMYVHYNLSRKIDSWCRTHGPNADLMKVISDDMTENQQQQDGEGDGQPDDKQQPSAGQPKPNPRQADAEAEAQREWQDEEQRQQRSEELRRQLQERQAQAAAAKAKDRAAAAEKLKQSAKQAKKDARKKSAADRRVALMNARHNLKRARQMTSFNKATEVAAPSLESRRNLASANGRLRAVPSSLRGRLAELINRLTGANGRAGSDVSPIPVYDSRKLVKRMLVKRPLPNALKEDVISGRPVTLFLPDISPSCADQAQDACDMANAAGYAGVSGSDVLVLPHSNGCIEGSADNYIPWFNGKPVDVRGEALVTLFHTIVGGRSQYKIRAVVAIGDHDAVDLYSEIAAFKQVTKMVWLHNEPSWRRPGRVVRAQTEELPSWPEKNLSKLTLLYGCTKQRHMLRGLEMALK